VVHPTSPTFRLRIFESYQITKGVALQAILLIDYARGEEKLVLLQLSDFRFSGFPSTVEPLFSDAYLLHLAFRMPLFVKLRVIDRLNELTTQVG
jgi:hypothetical protein